MIVPTVSLVLHCLQATRTSLFIAIISLPVDVRKSPTHSGLLSSLRRQVLKMSRRKADIKKNVDAARYLGYQEL